MLSRINAELPIGRDRSWKAVSIVGFGLSLTLTRSKAGQVRSKVKNYPREVGLRSVR